MGPSSDSGQSWGVADSHDECTKQESRIRLEAGEIDPLYAILPFLKFGLLQVKKR